MPRPRTPRPRFRTALALTGAAALLAACGGGGGGTSSTTAAAAPTGCAPQALDGASKPVEITVWHSMTRANNDTLVALTNQFNASQHDVHVTLVNQTSYTDTFEKFRAGLSTGQLPDVMQLQDTDLQQVIDSRAALPVQACVNATRYDTSDFIPRTLAYWTVKGTLWALPFNISNPVLIYDKVAFRKAGLDPEQPPATLAGLQSAAQALVRAGYQGMGLKLDPWHLEQWLALEGQAFVDNGNGRSGRATKVVFDNANGQRIFTALSDLVHGHVAVTNAATGPGQFDNLLGIANGKYGMTIDTSASLGTIHQVLSSGQFPGHDLGVGPMPGRADEGGVLVGGAAMYILARSSPAKQAAAWRYLTFLDQPDSQATWAAGTGYVPVRKSSVDTATIQNLWRTIPGFKVAYDQLVQGGTSAATAGPVLGAYVDVRSAVLDAEQSMFVNGVPPDQALADATRASDRAITAYNQRVGG